MNLEPKMRVPVGMLWRGIGVKVPFSISPVSSVCRASLKFVPAGGVVTNASGRLLLSSASCSLERIYGLTHVDRNNLRARSVCITAVSFSMDMNRWGPSHLLLPVRYTHTRASAGILLNS